MTHKSFKNALVERKFHFSIIKVVQCCYLLVKEMFLLQFSQMLLKELCLLLLNKMFNVGETPHMFILTRQRFNLISSGNAAEHSGNDF